MIRVSWKFYITICVTFFGPAAVLFFTGRASANACDATSRKCSDSCYKRLSDFLNTLTEEERLRVQGQKKFISSCLAECDSASTTCSRESTAMYIGAAVLIAGVAVVFVGANILASLRRRDAQKLQAFQEAREYKKLMRMIQTEQKRKRDRQVVVDPETGEFVAEPPAAIAELAGVRAVVNTPETLEDSPHDVVTCPECGAVFTSEKAKLIRTHQAVTESLFCINCSKVIAGIV